MNACDVIGYAYDADVHCVDCATEKFGDALDAEDTEDSEGNPLHPIFASEEGPEHGSRCGDCSEEIIPAWCDGCDDCVEGLDEFVTSYIETALWSSVGEDEKPLDDSYDESDVSESALKEFRKDCVAFLRDNAKLIGSKYRAAGHDFWLTRNHHGAGFWDGDWEDGDALTEAAHAFGSVDLYVSDDGKVYC